MRLAGTLPDQHDAATFVDYLLTLDIRAKAERNAVAWEVWIYDEDQLRRGREELTAFLNAPGEARYREAGKAAERLRREQVDRELAQRRANAGPRPAIAGSGRRPLTMSLLMASLLIWMLSDDGKNQTVVSRFLITNVRVFFDGTEIKTLPEIRRGEVWRLVSPIFLHFGLSHIVFNMFCLMDFGSRIEILRGWKRMLPMILLFAVPGNLAQYYFAGPSFGGMSGVVFGMFGYTWMKSRYEPWSGFYIQPFSVVFILVMFVLYLFGVMGPIANYCHAVGLLMGAMLGYAPTFFSSLRRR